MGPSWHSSHVLCIFIFRLSEKIEIGILALGNIQLYSILLWRVWSLNLSVKLSSLTCSQGSVRTSSFLSRSTRAWSTEMSHFGGVLYTESSISFSGVWSPPFMCSPSCPSSAACRVSSYWPWPKADKISRSLVIDPSPSPSLPGPCPRQPTFSRQIVWQQRINTAYEIYIRSTYLFSGLGCTRSISS